MRTKRKNVVKKIEKAGCLTILLVLMSLSTACGKSETDNTIEIVLVHGWGGTLETHRTMQSIYDEFEDENEDIQLNCIAYSDSSIAVEKANDMLAVGQMPDIVSTNGLSYYVNNAIKRDMALDLMPYIEEDDELAAMISQAVYETWETEDGTLYTVPDALEVAGYWYNKTYMEEAGITDEDGMIAEPDTWDEFMDMIVQLAEWCETQENISVCSLEETQLTEFLFPARLAAEDGVGFELVNENTVDAEAEILVPVLEDLGIISEKSKSVENIESARQDFDNGNSVLYFNGVWEGSELTDEDQIGYAVYPYCENENLAYVSASSGYVLAKQTDPEKEEACVRFLKYMLSDEVQQKIATSTGQMPSNPNVNTTEVWEENPVMAEAIEKIYDADVQIKMLRSVWSEDKVNVVESYMEKGMFSVEDAAAMAEELNRTK